MLNVSNAYKQAILSDKRQFKLRVSVNNQTYTEQDITSINWSDAAISGDDYQIGSAIAADIKLTFSHIVEGITEGQWFEVEIGLILPSGTTEYVPLGVFIVTTFDQKRNDNQTIIEGMDKFVYMEGAYTSKLKYPARITDVALEIANLASVAVNQTSFERLSTSSIELMEGYTYRQAIGLIAQFHAGFACFNRLGELEIRQLTDPNYSLSPTNYFSKGLDKNEVIYKVDGIQVRKDNQNEISVGNLTGNIISLDNKIMTKQLLDAVYRQLNSLNFYPFNLKWQGDPALEAGDWITIVDLKGNRFKVPNLEYSLTFNGGLSAVSSANQSSVSQSTYQFKGSMNQVIKDIQGWISAGGGNWTYTGLDTPENPKEGDTWFKYNGPDKEIWIYQYNDEGVLDWVLQVSTATNPELLEAIEQVEESVKQAQQDAETANANAGAAVNLANNANSKVDQTITTVNQVKLDVISANTNALAAVNNSTNALSSAQQALDQYANLSIGGRNYLLQTAAMSDLEGYEIVNSSDESELFRDNNVKSTVSDWSNLKVKPAKLIQRNVLEENQDYTYSQWVKVENESTPVNLYFLAGDSTYNYKLAGKVSSVDGWVRLKATFKYTDLSKITIDTQTYSQLIRFEASNLSNNGKLYFTSPKLERGNTLTDWSPAPEDVQLQLSTINDEVSLKVSQTSFDSLNGIVATQQTEINANKTAITQKANQTLVDTISGRVTTTEGLISTMADEISLKASQSEVNRMSGKVSVVESTLTTQAGQISAVSSRVTNTETNISTLKQDYSGLSSTVSSIKNGFDAISVGGRNFLLESANMSDKSGYEIINSTLATETFRGNAVYSTQRSWESIKVRPAELIKRGLLEQNQDYSFTQWVKVVGSSTPVKLVFYAGDSSLNNVLIKEVIPENGWVRLSATFRYSDISKITLDTQTYNQLIRFEATNLAGNGTLFYSSPKLEKGNLVTDWSPAPEDLVSVTEFSNLSQTVSAIQLTVVNKANQSQVTQLANQITSIVTNINSTNVFPDFDFSQKIAPVAGVISYDYTSGIGIKFANLTTAKDRVYWPNLLEKGCGYRISFTANSSDDSAVVEFGQSDGDNFKAKIDFAAKAYTGEFTTTNSNLAFSIFIPANLHLRLHTLKIEKIVSQSQLTQLSDSINLRVSKNDVVNQINLSSEGILIAGNKVQITGQTYIADAVIGTAQIKDAAITSAKFGSIVADKIVGGTFNGATMNVINLNAESISNGTLSSVYIQGQYGYWDLKNGVLRSIYPDLTSSYLEISRGQLAVQTSSSSTTLGYGGLSVSSQSNGYTALGTYTSGRVDFRYRTQRQQLRLYDKGLVLTNHDESAANDLSVTIWSKGTNANLDFRSNDYGIAGSATYDVRLNVARGMSGFNGSGYLTISAYEMDLSNVYFVRPAKNMITTTLGVTWSQVNLLNLGYVSSSEYTLNITAGDNYVYKLSLWRSDQELKNNIKQTDVNGLDRINQLKVRQFDWLDSGGHTNIGLVAQEVESVIPEAVLNGGTHKQLTPNGFIPTMIKATQELSRESDFQHMQLINLQMEISSLKREIEKLKKSA